MKSAGGDAAGGDLFVGSGRKEKGAIIEGVAGDGVAVAADFVLEVDATAGACGAVKYLPAMFTDAYRQRGRIGVDAEIIEGLGAPAPEGMIFEDRAGEEMFVAHREKSRW